MAGNSSDRREWSYDCFGDLEKGKEKKVQDSGNDSYSYDVNHQTSDSAAAAPMDDPPSKLIGQFLHKQHASGEVCLDMDLLELHNDGVVHHNLAPVSESSTMLNRGFSFDSNPPGSNDSTRRFQHNRNSPSITTDSGGVSEVLKCSSRDEARISKSSSFKRKSNLFKERTKSRLMDPPRPQRRSEQQRSGFLGRASVVEEDDPLVEEDLPEEYKIDKFSNWTLLQLVSLIVIVAALVCSLAIPYFRNKNLWRLQLWKWDLLVLVLICGRLVSGWVIRIFVFFIERNFLLRKRVLYFVYGVKKAVQNCLWLGLVSIAWHFLFDKKIESETRSHAVRLVTRILVCAVVGTILWLIKTLVVKVLESSFHVSTFFDRIQESLFNQYVIETLSGPPLIEIKENEEEEERAAADFLDLENAGAHFPPDLKATHPTTQRSPKLSREFSIKSNQGDDGIRIDHLHKWNPKNVSAWNMKRLIHIVSNGALYSLDEQVTDSNHDDDDEPDTKIRSEFGAKVASTKIFRNVAKPGSSYIFLEDIMRFMPEDEALKALGLFEGASESNKVRKKCLKNWMVNAFRERRALALSLNDTKKAVNKLQRMVNALVAILIGVIWLLILGIATSKFLVFLSSQLLLVAFIFGNTCKTIFEAVIFLFVIHPFDVGDRCEIDGVQLVVEEMKILTTVFLRDDNQKTIITNSILATKTIGNLYRSPHMGDAVEFLIHIATPAEKIAVLKQRINSYVENTSEHWYPAPMIIFKDVEDMTRVRFAVWLSHKMNHQDMGERWARRALLVEEMVKIFKELDMQYRLFPIDVNVRVLPLTTAERLPPNWT